MSSQVRLCNIDVFLPDPGLRCGVAKRVVFLAGATTNPVETDGLW